jgi:hypothetical protein
MPLLLSLQNCDLEILQWFGQEEDSWEPERSIRDSVHYDTFWKAFKTKRNLLKVGHSKIASENKIREFFFFQSPLSDRNQSSSMAGRIPVLEVH